MSDDAEFLRGICDYIDADEIGKADHARLRAIADRLEQLEIWKAEADWRDNTDRRRK